MPDTTVHTKAHVHTNTSKKCTSLLRRRLLPYGRGLPRRRCFEPSPSMRSLTATPPIIHPAAHTSHQTYQSLGACLQTTFRMLRSRQKKRVGPPKRQKKRTVGEHGPWYSTPPYQYQQAPVRQCNSVERCRIICKSTTSTLIAFRQKNGHAPVRVKMLKGRGKRKE